MRTILRAVGGVAALVMAAGPAGAAYEGGWYKTPFWSGEYPRGITMESDTTTMLRAAPDPDAPQTIECALPQGATYHPWNIARVESDQLEFVTFSPIIENVVVTDGTVFAYPPLSMEAIELTFQAGDTWEFLAYLGEGFFVMRYEGVVYEAGQELYEFSEAAGAAADDRQPDEWLRLTCSNGARGWLRLGEVIGTPGFGDTPITNYGEAADVE